MALPPPDLPLEDLLVFLTLQAERTRKLWGNPLSIYAPDPLRLEIAMFNASLREQQRDMRRAFDELLEARRERGSGVRKVDNVRNVCKDGGRNETCSSCRGFRPDGGA